MREVTLVLSSNLVRRVVDRVGERSEAAAIRWRRPFHELNAIVSRLSLLQSQTDMLDIDDVTLRRHNRLVLGLVSDQLGLIGTLASFYTQENASLLFNSISELVHERCNALKLNIQLKILQSNVRD